jgi:type I restriction enzyme S subunit
MTSYPEYKSSGVDWLGEIPTHWQASRLKMFSKIYSGGTPDTKEKKYWENGTVPWIASGEVNQELITEVTTYITKEALKNSSAKWIPKNAIVMALAGQGRTKGTVALTGVEVTCNQSLAAIVTKNTNYKYLFYWLKSKYQDIRGLVGEDRDGLNLDLIGAISIPIPLLAEQQKIVDFLDYKMGQCDRFISNRQKQIELLNEQKAAIINKAVTKGINPNAKMKPSGIDWIGDIPEHWECMKIKRLSVVKRGASPRPIDDPKYFDENGEFAWVRIADVTASERYLENTTQRLSKLGSSLSVKMYPNDFFLSIAGSVGKPIITKIKCCIHDGFVWFPYLKINHEFLYYLFSTGLPYQGLGKFGTQLNLNTDTVGDIFLPIPTADEMTIIVSFIDNQTQKIDCLISKYQKQIELMQEYRTALISQAVTGKIDVREWKPQTK